MSERKTQPTTRRSRNSWRFAALMATLGKHKTGKSCLYLKTLADVDADSLQALIDGSVAAMEARRIRC